MGKVNGYQFSVLSFQLKKYGVLLLIAQVVMFVQFAICILQLLNLQ